jgi:hypothetical protein
MSANDFPSVPPTLSIDLGDSLKFAVRRQVTVLFTEYLAILSQLGEEHSEALDKLYAVLPPEYRDHVDLADHFTEEKGKRIRKAVLDRGNDCWRAIHEEIDKYDIQFSRNTPPPQP